MSHLVPDYAKFSAENETWERDKKQPKCKKRHRDQATEDRTRCNLSIAYCGNRYLGNESDYSTIRYRIASDKPLTDQHKPIYVSIK